MEFAFALEPEPEELRHQILVFRKGDHAVANIARRHHAKIRAQPSGTSAIVRHRDNNREMGRPILQPAEKRGQTRAPSN